jgi:hypothetical protein
MEGRLMYIVIYKEEGKMSNPVTYEDARKIWKEHPELCLYFLLIIDKNEN